MDDKNDGAGLAAVGNDTIAASPKRQAPTPGPWHLSGTGDDRNITQTAADWHLIAAAPEMKDALKVALEHITELRDAWARGVIREADNLGGTRSNRNVEVESLLVAAIAKAEGR